jgi:hypothetical protein
LADHQDDREAASEEARREAVSEVPEAVLEVREDHRLEAVSEEWAECRRDADMEDREDHRHAEVADVWDRW